MSLYQDWTQYLSDHTAFDEGHFEQLLYEDDLYKSPGRLFETLPGGRVIIERLTKMTLEWQFSGTYFVAGGSADEGTQIARADLHRTQLALFGADEGLDDDAAQLRSVPIIPTRDRAAFEAMSRDRNLNCSEIPELLGDIEYDLMSHRDPRLLGAQTAILELTKRPEVTSWIMAESMALPIDLEPAYQLYRDGAKLLLASDAVHLLLPQS